MALINIETALRRVMEQLKKVAAGSGVEVLTYKRNRGLTLIKRKDGMFWVRERGYRDEEYIIQEKELLRTVRGILKRECPRSRKVRIYSISAERLNVMRKVL